MGFLTDPGSVAEVEVWLEKLRQQQPTDQRQQLQWWLCVKKAMAIEIGQRMRNSSPHAHSMQLRTAGQHAAAGWSAPCAALPALAHRGGVLGGWGCWCIQRRLLAFSWF